MAWLSPSEPPAVKTTSAGEAAPSSPATRSRASLTPASAAAPKRCMLEGLP